MVLDSLASCQLLLFLVSTSFVLCFVFSISSLSCSSSSCQLLFCLPPPSCALSSLSRRLVSCSSCSLLRLYLLCLVLVFSISSSSLSCSFFLSLLWRCLLHHHLCRPLLHLSLALLLLVSPRLNVFRLLAPSLSCNLILVSLTSSSPL